ncbi:MAG: SIMPL domain-containing protein [Fimbriimonadaceae bacterium]|nr:SIMPL domain-containing protein [Alphaproteobacteria bacterium]
MLLPDFNKPYLTGQIALFAGAFLLAVWSMITLAPVPAYADDEKSKPGIITLEGVGEVSGRPDMAVVSTGVVSEAKTARDALTANTKAMSDVIAWLKDNGIADKDIQTSGFSVQPRYTQAPVNSNGERPPPRIVGYTVSNQVTIRVRDINNLGIILDQVVTTGSNQINGVSFTFAEPGKLLDEARALAMKDAIRKAEIYTSAAGIKLGRITVINEQGGYQPMSQYARGRAMAMESPAPVPMEAGEQTMSIQINVSWELAD